MTMNTVFRSTDSNYKDLDGQPCEVLRTISEPDETHDEECLPMYLIRCGSQDFEAWAEEIEVADLERTNR